LARTCEERGVVVREVRVLESGELDYRRHGGEDHAAHQAISRSAHRRIRWERSTTLRSPGA
jgi:hypothetical protein